MSGFSTYLSNNTLNFVFKGTEFTSPTKYLALFKDDAGLSTNAQSTWVSNELTSGVGSYERLALPNSIWSESTSGFTNNTEELSYAIASSSWGNITHVGIMDAATSGNCLAYGALVNPITQEEDSRQIEIGDQLIIRPYALSVTLH